MSKYVKNLITDDLRQRLDGVDNALLVNVSGLDANKNNRLRMTLNEKNIQLLMVKNSLARRATEGTPLAAAFEQMEGSLAIVWGSEDIVSLAKEIARLADDKQYEAFHARGGVMEGAQLTAEQVKQVSKWPSRPEQLSILMGQILSPGANLSSQLLSQGGALASQIEELVDRLGGGSEGAAPAGEEVPAGSEEAPAGGEEAPAGGEEASA